MLIVLALEIGVPAINSARNGHKMDPMRRGGGGVSKDSQGCFVVCNRRLYIDNFFSEREDLLIDRGRVTRRAPCTRLFFFFFFLKENKAMAAPSSSPRSSYTCSTEPHVCPCLQPGAREGEERGCRSMTYEEAGAPACRLAGWLPLESGGASGDNGVAVTCV